MLNCWLMYKLRHFINYKGNIRTIKEIYCWLPTTTRYSVRFKREELEADNVKELDDKRVRTYLTSFICVQ